MSFLGIPLSFAGNIRKLDKFLNAKINMPMSIRNLFRGSPKYTSMPMRVYGDELPETPETQRYKNLTGLSGIENYMIKPGGMDIKFKSSPKIYDYPESYTGRHNLEIMEMLANGGQGLNRFVNRHVRQR